MNADYEKNYHEVERNHWWFKSRRNILLKLINGQKLDARILDIGCSSGLMLKELKKLDFNVENLYGVDISERAITNCRNNGFGNTFVMDAHSINLPEQSFDFIIASDCLEHLERDEEALANWFSLLKPEGHIIIFVPAFQFLWSSHDDVNFHFRRYTRKELKQKMQKQKFSVQKSGYWNFSLFLPVAVVRFLDKIFKNNSQKKNLSGDMAMPHGVANKALCHLVNAENRLIPSITFPFGVSTFCIATKQPIE